MQFHPGNDAHIATTMRQVCSNVFLTFSYLDAVTRRVLEDHALNALLNLVRTVYGAEISSLVRHWLVGARCCKTTLIIF